MQWTIINHMKALKLPRASINQLLTHAQKHAPLEACGLIGHDKQQVSIYPIDNIAAQAERLFEMDPRQQIAAMKSMREKNEDLLAIYHSHPSAAATPSLIDWEQMSDDSVYYLIISLNTIGVLEIKAYWPGQNKFENVELEIS